VLTVGITGGIGSGKSAVSAMLVELGAFLVDADADARTVVAKGTPGLSRVVAAFGPEIEEALDHPVDFKSALQERLAQQALVVVYTVTEQRGPPHERIFDVTATIGAEVVAKGSGRSKKAAEQAAARAALDASATRAPKAASGVG